MNLRLTGAQPDMDLAPSPHGKLGSMVEGAVAFPPYEQIWAYGVGKFAPSTDVVHSKTHAMPQLHSPTRAFLSEEN